MRPGILATVALFGFGIAMLGIAPPAAAVSVVQRDGRQSAATSIVSNQPSLSPYWDADIQILGDTIGALSDSYGFHPDFIAAVIYHESQATVQSGADGEAGPGGALAFVPGFQMRTAVDGTEVSLANLRWGMAILSYAVQQSGGDLFTALAAYHAGWQNVGDDTSREFAAGVLESYARSLTVRSGFSSTMAASWSVAVEIRAGNVPTDATLVLGNRPVTRLRKFAEHTVYAFAGSDGQAYDIRGYIVPVGLAELSADEQSALGTDELEAPLRARLGDKLARKAGPSRVLLACLPSLERLRGQVRTRWFAPADCPPAGR